MALQSVNTGDIIRAADINQFVNLLTGVSGSGQSILLIYNAAGAVILQPSTDPIAGTELFQVKNAAGTVLGAVSSDGKLYAADGTALLPGVTFELDKDTGIYRVGANDIALTTSGVQRLRLDANGVLYVASQPVVNEYNAGNSGTALTIDWNNGDTQRVTMTGNCTFTFSNPVAGRTYTLILTQDGTGSRTATWPTAVKWAAGSAPTLTTTATTGRDVLTFLYSGGLSIYIGVSVLDVR